MHKNLERSGAERGLETAQDMLTLLDHEELSGRERELSRPDLQVLPAPTATERAPSELRPPVEVTEADEFSSQEVEPSVAELAQEEEHLQAKVGAAVAPEPEEGPQLSPKHSSSSYDGEGVFKLYLREIGPIKLLTAQEEVDLALRIQQGDKKARELMIKSNLRLVVKLARDYEGIGLPLLDLISEGNIGLMKAVERFDPTKGTRFATYAAWWIKQAMKRALSNQSKMIRLPVHLVEKLFHMSRTALKLQEELGREPTDEEVGEELGLTAAQITAMRAAASRPVSLDAPVGAEESHELGELVADEQAETPYERLEEKAATGMLRQMVQKLSPREGAILRARFGLDGGPEKTLDQVARDLGVTRERVRQVQQNALRKMRQMLSRIEAS